MNKNEIKIGDIKIKVLRRIFYCRHCAEPSRYCISHHRSGLYYIIQIEPFVQPKNIFIVGAGEIKDNTYEIIQENDLYYVKVADAKICLGKLEYTGMSGCEDYEYAHITMSGWLSFINTPIVEEITPDKNLELNDFEKILISEELESHRRWIVINIPTNIDWGIWERHKKLAYFYESSGAIRLPLGAVISKYPTSFQAEFEFQGISFKIPKISKADSTFINDNIVFIRVKKRLLYYGSINERRIVYYFREHPMIYGHERVRDELQSPAILESPPFDYNDTYKWHKFMKLLFLNRLGDVVFIPEDNENIEYFDEINGNQLSKIKILNAKIEDNMLTPTSDEDIVLYHPDHGTLSLKPRQYVIKAVRYYRRGYD
ncbi:MAG: hypothetical protein Q6363_009750 [Candidatus Njordarchaeota archaeon]